MKLRILYSLNNRILQDIGTLRALIILWDI